MIEFLSQPWHWSISGVGIVIVMFLLIMIGRSFGVSSSFRDICTIAGAKNLSSYFDYNIKDQYWLFVFIFGSILGGTIASTVLQSPTPVAISSATISDLSQLGIHTPKTISEGAGFLPEELFHTSQLFKFKNILLMIVGGFLIGFGTRYAGGCTSGHAITGLSNFQLPSLVAVIGFFIGGLFMTHFLLPFFI